MARKMAEWMCTLDERIIEYVTEDSLANPRLMASAIQFNASKRRIRERCQMLTDAGLIAPISDDAQLYEVTREGQRYLDGDLDVEHQPRPRARG